MKNMDARCRLDCATHRFRHASWAGLALCLTACSAAPPATPGLVSPSGPGVAFGAVEAALETEPVANGGDAADDAVVLANGSGRPPLIVGTDKQYGLRVYGLGGKQLQALPVGRLNNVDAVEVRPDEFLLAASNRTSNSIDFFSASLLSRTVTQLGSEALSFEEPYGLCMAKFDDDTHVFVGDKEGQVQHWVFGSTLDGNLKTTFLFDTQTEGCVVDTATATLFVGEENAGIWSVELATGKVTLYDNVRVDYLEADIEGLDIYDNGRDRYLIASSQGDSSYVVYDLDGLRPLLKLAIAANAGNGVDGASHTDGIAVTEAPLPGFPAGVLVVQDGENTAPAAPQNFKIVDWRAIAELLTNNQ